MASSGNKRSEGSRRLSWPWVLILAAMVLFGAITLLQWVLNTFAAVIKASLAIVVLVAVASWVYSAINRR